MLSTLCLRSHWRAITSYKQLIGLELWTPPSGNLDFFYFSFQNNLGIPRAQMTFIFEGQPLKTRPFPSKARVIWVLGTYTQTGTLPFRQKWQTEHLMKSHAKMQASGHIYGSTGIFTWHLPWKLTRVQNVHVPGTQMTLVLVGKGVVLGGWPSKNRGQWGSRYIVCQ